MFTPVEILVGLHQKVLFEFLACYYLRYLILYFDLC